MDKEWMLHIFRQDKTFRFIDEYGYVNDFYYDRNKDKYVEVRHCGNNGQIKTYWFSNEIDDLNREINYNMKYNYLLKIG